MTLGLPRWACLFAPLVAALMGASAWTVLRTEETTGPFWAGCIAAALLQAVCKAGCGVVVWADRKPADVELRVGAGPCLRCLALDAWQLLQPVTPSCCFGAMPAPEPPPRAPALRQWGCAPALRRCCVACAGLEGGGALGQDPARQVGDASHPRACQAFSRNHGSCAALLQRGHGRPGRAPRRRAGGAG